MSRVIVIAAALSAACAGQAGLTLAQLQQMALARNPTLQQAQDAAAAAAGEARQAGMWPNPTVGYQGEQIRGGAFQGGEQGAFVQQTIPLGGKLQAAQAAARAREQGRRAELAAQRQAVRTAVALAYYDALAAARALTLRGQGLTLAEDAATTTAQMANVGQADQPDEARAAIAVETAQAAQAAARAAVHAAWARLAAVVGDPGLIPQPLAGHLAPGPAALDTAGYVERLLTQSPALAAARSGVAAAEAELAAARKRPIPDLELRGGVEDNRELQANGRAAGAQAFASAGVALPLFNRNQGGVAAAVARLAGARAEVTRLRLALRAEAAPVLARYRAAAQAAAAYARMLPQAERAEHMLDMDYWDMTAGYPEVLAARRRRLALQRAQARTLRELWRSDATLRGMLLTAGLRPAEDGMTQGMR